MPKLSGRVWCARPYLLSVSRDLFYFILFYEQFNKLRKYRSQVVKLERELKEHKEQASSVKGKFAEYNNELHKNLQLLREEKKNWITEAAALRTKEKEAQACLIFPSMLARAA
jgi:biopolymer transport protein ExbB/TolQ